MYSALVFCEKNVICFITGQWIRKSNKLKIKKKLAKSNSDELDQIILIHLAQNRFGQANYTLSTPTSILDMSFYDLQPN